MTAPRTLAIVNDWDGLLAALRSRVAELQLTHEVADAISGLQPGYCSKLLAPTAIRNIGPISLGPLLGCLAVRLVIEEDLDAFRKIESRLTKRSRQKQGDAGNGMLAKKRKRRQPFAPFRRARNLPGCSAARQILNQSQGKRSRIARQAAKARWRQVRAARRAPPAVVG